MAKALGLTHKMPNPAGSIKPFCEPLTAMSTPQSSKRKSRQPNDDTQSTNNNAHACDVRGHAGGGFVVASQHGFELMRGVGFQNVSELLQWHACAPFAFHDVHIKAEALAHVDPQMAELTKPRGQHFVARRKRVGEGGLPAASAR
jgi:hypothetical protein